MREGKRGFTLIEVGIFLAITGLLFMGIMIGVQNSVYQQRSNDAIQSFMEFLRTVYAEVTDVQSTGGGNGDQAIYGKLVTFGEETNLAGEPNDKNEIIVYTVMGDVVDTSGMGLLEALDKSNATISDDNGFAGIVESYVPKWGTRISSPCISHGYHSSCPSGMMLIARHPNSGVVTTFWSWRMLDNDRSVGSWSEGGFVPVQIDFCLDTGLPSRADVRIIRGARSAAGIELLFSDMEGYACSRP